MKFTLHKKLSVDDALAHTITAIQTLQGVSYAIGSVPFLSIVFGSALSLLTTIEQVRGDTARSVRLAKRISSLLHLIEQTIGANLDAVDDTLLRNLTLLQETLLKIEQDLRAFAAKSASSRFLRRASISGKLDEHLETVEDASRSFHIASLIALRQQVNQQASYDEDQLRLFRFSDLQLGRVQGTWSADPGVSGDEYEGKWGGRLVTIRVLRKKGSKLDKVLPVVRQLLQCPHPYVVQVLGYSHPSSSPSFYVLEKGTLDVLSYLANVDAFTKLQWYLRMFIDLKDAINHFDSLKLTARAPAKMHRCLPSLALKEDGTLFVSAEDLVHAHWGCLYYRMAVLYGKIEAPQPIDASAKTQDMPAESTHNLLSVLDPNSEPSDVVRSVYERRNSYPIVWPGIYSSVSFDKDLGAALGDYGYFDPETQAFVSLGNVFELLQCEKTFDWLYVTYHGATVETSTSDYTWSEKTWRYPLEAGEERRVEIEQNLCKTTRSTFFWFHACDVAAQHGIALEDLRLVETLSQCWGLKVADSGGRIEYDGPKEAYFHQLPQQDDEIPSQFGFWSLESERSFNLPYELSLAGVELDCK
ncbi:hypothetical protein OBBRIDRAFT_794957 [Obba rivulosa]|uniref:Uncharacterized protein n=1 Tax=Obba rivulosa TaxID=1052685 RepID=A0A8E2AV90_9APHY|nr:hypothetical protein OBBRIDRAFT_794957 [Obba rivulosa]